MKTFLFEQYGYYPTEIQNNSFEVDNWRFKLIEINYNDDYIDQIDNYIKYFRNIFNKGPHIIKTRFNKNVSMHDGKRYVLISVYKFNFNLNDLNKMHICFLQADQRINLKKLLNSWKKRMLSVENDAIRFLRIDSVYYEKNLQISMYILGIAQNALQYLNEIILDYGENLENLTLTHKRLRKMSSDEFCDPFNFVIDHPIRDLANLYKSNFLDFEELINAFKYYEIDRKLASVFIARLMFPAETIDLLEENAIKKDTSFKLEYNIENEFYKLKKIYNYLEKMYSIRPIDWLKS